MKVNGQAVSPRVVTFHVPTNTGAVEFRFRALTSDDKFEDVVKRPKPPVRTMPGNKQMTDNTDINYLAALADWSGKMLEWQILQSMSATQGLEFDTVKMNDPESWKNWRKEMGDNLGSRIVDHCLNAYVDANLLSEETLEEARKSFLAGQEEKLNKLSNPSIELNDMPSGGVVNDLA